MFLLQGNTTSIDVPRISSPLLPRILQNTTSSTLSRYVKHDREILDQQQDYYFPYINEAINTISMTATLDSFVALRPNKATNGGYGNLLWFFAEVHGVAMATKRHAIVNNAALNALFSFPTTNSTTNQSVMTNAEVNRYFEHRGAKYTELMPCGQVAKSPLSSWGKYVFVHGCFGTLPLPFPNPPLPPSLPLP